jgi:hypothetical protein
MRPSVVWRGIGLVRTGNPASGYFEFGNLAPGVQRAMSQTIGAANAGPVVWNEYRIRTDGFDNHRSNGQIVAAGCDRHPISIFDSVALSQTRMNFRSRFWILIDQGADASRLGTG